MKVMAQVGMVMNLDKCIGCHTCSVTCKQAWTNRAGTEYVWFNNVETRPGQGYPRRYEDQERWRGGWELNRRGRLKLKAGGRVKKLLGIFASPVQPELNDYYEPWTYDYETLTEAPLGDDFPVARPKSLITGEDTKIEWSANWDDNLGGTSQLGHLDPIVEKIRKESEDKIKFEFEQTFMFYLPRICEHCLNPSCMASCPSGAIYKREEDGIVLVDQDRWRGGWELNRRGRLKLKSGGRVKKLLGIFASPVQPELNDYYEPWTYDYETLTEAPLGDDFPVARPKSLITG
ncbi:MAG TPA: 4Fe-4S dicluster domain-containing protein, partial [Arthrobacter sp.]|nr:4Fe-4S dicluster domain-containing protein [Arthrobacter sp.]